MQGLGFNEFYPRNNVLCFRKQIPDVQVWTASKLKAYEKQTSQKHWRFPSASEDQTHGA
jgi:hypothetical protein